MFLLWSRSKPMRLTPYGLACAATFGRPVNQAYVQIRGRWRD